MLALVFPPPSHFFSLSNHDSFILSITIFQFVCCRVQSLLQLTYGRPLLSNSLAVLCHLKFLFCSSSSSSFRYPSLVLSFSCFSLCTKNIAKLRLPCNDNMFIVCSTSPRLTFCVLLLLSGSCMRGHCRKMTTRRKEMSSIKKKTKRNWKRGRRGQRETRKRIKNAHQTARRKQNRSEERNERVIASKAKHEEEKRRFEHGLNFGMKVQEGRTSQRRKNWRRDEW